MENKIELKEKITAVDQNIRELWDAMDEQNQKLLKSELFILNRYISSVGKPKYGKNPTREQQEQYVLLVNEYFNKNFYQLQKHPKLLWLLLCMCSYDGQTSFYHEWIGNKKRNSSDSKKVKFLEEVYPDKKIDELEVLAKISTNEEIKELAIQLGLDDQEIKKILK